MHTNGVYKQIPMYRVAFLSGRTFDRDNCDMTEGRSPVLLIFLLNKLRQIIMERFTPQQRSEIVEIQFQNQCFIDFFTIFVKLCKVMKITTFTSRIAI